MNGTGCFRRGMTRNAAGKRELREQTLHSCLVLGHVRIQFAVGALEVSVGHHTRPPMTGASDVDHIQIALLNDPIEMNVDEIQSWRRAPMSKEPRLDMLALERFFEQWIVVQINLADRQIVCRPPIRVHLPEQLRGERSLAAGRRLRSPFSFVRGLPVSLDGESGSP